MMDSIVERFGTIIQKICETDPQAARRLLRLGYHAKNLSLKLAPEKGMTKAAQYGAVKTMTSMIRPLSHPEKAAMVSLFTPCEMLQVLELYPYSCEGFGCFLSGSCAEASFLQYAEEQGLPETFCSYHKAFIGAAEKGLMPKPRFIINTTLACDANLLTFRHLSEFFQVPQFVLDIPYEQDDNAVAYVARQLADMKVFLEKETGRKIDETLLEEAVGRSQRTMAGFDRYMSLKAEKSIPSDLAGELFTSFLLHTLLGSREAEQYVNLCLKEAEKAPDTSGLRLLWMHTTPFWMTPLRRIFNFNPEIQIVGCDMCFEGLTDADAGDPYTAMALRIVRSAFNGPVSRRILRGIQAARQLKADGVVYFCHWGCKHTLGGAKLAKEHFEAAGFPCLILDGDGCDRSHGGEGQQATRAEAFIEMLRDQKGEHIR